LFTHIVYKTYYMESRQKNSSGKLMPELLGLDIAIEG